MADWVSRCTCGFCWRSLVLILSSGSEAGVASCEEADWRAFDVVMLMG